MFKRNEYIDTIKGIGIILVMLGHSISAIDQPLNRFILSFHMPLFFFSSGLLFYTRDIKTEKLQYFFKKRLKSIAMPLIITSILQISGDMIILAIKDNSIIHYNFLTSINWFLISYFIMSNVCWIIIRISNREIIYILGLFFLLLLVSFFCPNINYFKQAIVASVFCLLGYFFRPFVDQFDKKFSGLFIILISISSLLSTINAPIGMYKNQYGNMTLFYITAIIGILAIVDLSKLFVFSTYIKYLGRNCIVIYCTHFFVRRVIQTILIVFFKQNKNFEYPSFIVTFMILISVESILLLIFHNYVRNLFINVQPNANHL